MTRKAKTIKDVAREQLAYCKQIADDIIKHGASEAVQRHANKYAEIESPFIGGTCCDWVRINAGMIYIFLEARHTAPFTLNGEVTVQADYHGQYGGELIEAYSYDGFLKCLEDMDESEIWDHIRLADTDFERCLDEKEKNEVVKDLNPSKWKYVPFEES